MGHFGIQKEASCYTGKTSPSNWLINILGSYVRCFPVKSLWDTLPHKRQYWYNFQNLLRPFVSPYSTHDLWLQLFLEEAAHTVTLSRRQTTWQTHFYT